MTATRYTVSTKENLFARFVLASYIQRRRKRASYIDRLFSSPTREQRIRRGSRFEIVVVIT